MRFRICFVVLFVLGLLCSRSGPVAGQDSPSVRRSSSAIALTADGATLLVVNPDSNSLTLVDTASRAVLAEIPVGVDPRTVAVDDLGQRAYVANRGSGSVSVVDLAARAVVAEVDVGYRPYGVVVSADGSRLYVAVQGADRLVVLDTATLTIVRAIPVADRPSGLALSADPSAGSGQAGETLYLTHLLNNTITVLPTVRPDPLPAPHPQECTRHKAHGTRLA